MPYRKMLSEVAYWGIMVYAPKFAFTSNKLYLLVRAPEILVIAKMTLLVILSVFIYMFHISQGNF